ncbi:methyltransferase domain-containing protein [Stenotrophomonas sp. ISL-67]|nr:methyltransferase domain-containing protein [Stenotrophomonas sp. ISL-67]MBT2768125.1 methyltransferase domain-containing protein [Stenotrophomonas sp. ISL-67]
MTQTLLDIPFDHYQRYAAAAHLLNALELPNPSVLEVGANRQRLLGQFLPSASLLYTDLHAEGDEQDFVVADATALPFADQSFDSIVSLDVIEHIPAHLRRQAIAEMARVAGRVVIVGFPPDRPWVHAAELDANGRWQELFGDDYAWLQEHKELGLVNTEEVVATFEAAGLQVVRFGQGNSDMWSSLMGAHFIKVKFPELEPLVAAADRLYNSRVFAGDQSDQPYREYYVGLRREEDVAKLRANPPFQAQPDEEATALLSGLAHSLRSLALRTDSSEREWASTARLLEAYAADLAVAKQEWGATAAFAQTLQAAKDETDKAFFAREAEVHALQGEWQASQQQWDARQEEWQALQQSWDAREAELLSREEVTSRRLTSEREADAALHRQEREALERTNAEAAAAYARSRRKWKSAMVVIALAGLSAGAAVAWVL